MVDLTLLVVILVSVAVLLCFWVFCLRLEPQPEDWEYFDRSHVTKNAPSSNNAGTEGMEVAMEVANPEQEAAVARLNLIQKKVIEKEVVESSEKGRRKSNINIRIPKRLSMGNWGSNVPSETAKQKLSAETPPPKKVVTDDKKVRRASAITYKENSNMNISQEGLDGTTDNTMPRRTSAAFGDNFEDIPKRKSIGGPSDRKCNIEINSIGRSIRRQSIRNSITFVKTKISNVATNKRKSMELYTTEKCFICQELYKAGEKIYWSPNDKCVHSFHSKCMFPWLMKSYECPLCRQDYLFDSADKCVTAKT